LTYEEPFSILPLEALCEEVAVAADAMLEGRASARAPLVEAGRRATPPARRGGVGPAMLLHAEDAGATLLAAALSATQQQERYFFAGGLCASLSHALATPIDVVKTKQQTRPEFRDLSLLDGLRRVAQADGPAALLTGVAPTVVGYGLEGACKFGVYEALKPASAPLLASLGLGADQSAAAGPVAAAVVAGGLASLVLAPAEATRIRMVSEPSYASLGLLGAASRLYEAEGAAGLLQGVPATCAKQLPYTATKQVTFDALVDAAARAAPSPLPRWASTAGAAAAAAVLSTLASQPGDAILSEVSSGGADHEGGVWAAAERLGADGLVRGLRARLAQVGVIVTVQLVLYDTLKHAFGVP